MGERAPKTDIGSAIWYAIHYYKFQIKIISMFYIFWILQLCQAIENNKGFQMM